MKIPVVVVVMWSDMRAIKEGNVEVTDCKPSLFSCAVCYKFYLEQAGLRHLIHNQYINQQMQLMKYNSWQVLKSYVLLHWGAILREVFTTKEYKPNMPL